MGGGYDDRWLDRGEPDDEIDERHLALVRGLRSTAGIPEDARKMGLDRNTVEGALVGFTGSLDSSRLSHRIVAWVLLVVFVLPQLLNLLRQIF